ncbi:thiamine-phosphate kinase [Nocardia goodfellowii]|uniref:Thiamine-monophosphate kinase n=1 Tax=Nocardia goodfellowii TaxID=882446 RepID=A0ABS4Q744_9NOCA|nr:thiamine-phosphate kinase [Nocardia goodfellowii]MBP2187507.1 thiamine-monophosphate kinase [Nocardia goodfellowii]
MTVHALTTDTPLDEPSKIAEIVVPTMGDQQSTTHLANGSTAALLLGAGAQDDCAAFRLSGDQVLVAGTDYVRGPKFSLYEKGFISNYDIGWYLAGANISDVAAMGAVPLGLLSVVRYPKNLQDDDFAELMEGIRDGARAAGAHNVGGDIGTAERIILSASAFGVVEPGNILARTGARPGQVLCTTGPTGLAGSAMKLANAGVDIRHRKHSALLSKWQRVAPRVTHGRAFALDPAVTSCIDTSDGLKGAVETLARASDVSILVDEATLPIHDAVREAASELNCEVLDLVFGDSVDFELVVTVDAEAVDALSAKFGQSDLDFHVIGRVEAGSGAGLLRGQDTMPIPGASWKHA